MIRIVIAPVVAMLAFLGVWIGAGSGDPVQAESNESVSSSEAPRDVNVVLQSIGDYRALLWSDARAQTESVLEQARQALQNDRFESAALIYRTTAAALPESPASANTWFLAGVAAGRGGKPHEAIADCERAVAVFRSFLNVDHYNPPTYAQGTPHMESVKDGLYRALRFKAEQHAAAGDSEQAKLVILELKAEAPEYPLFRKILPLQAQLHGESAELLAEREHAAWKASDQAKWAWGDADAATAIQWADFVLQEYPETAGAMLARQCKGRVLWRTKRYDEARKVYEELLGGVEAINPTCELAREARAKLAYLDAVPQIRSLIRSCQGNARASIAVEDWIKVRSTCRTVMSEETTPGARAAAHVIYIESLHFQGLHEEVLREVRKFKDLHNRSEHLEIPDYRNYLLWVNYYSGWGMLKLGRAEEAGQRFRMIIDVYEKYPDKWYRGTCLPQAYFGLWHALRDMGTSAEEAKAAVAPLLEVYPSGSYYVRTITSAK